MADLRRDRRELIETEEGREEAKRLILESVAAGMEEETAAQFHGVTERTFMRWKGEDAAFADALVSAFTLKKGRLVDRYYQRAMKGSDRAAEFILSHMDERFKDGKGLGASGKAIGDMTVSELESHIADLRRQKDIAEKTIDGEAAPAPRAAALPDAAN